MDATIEDLTNLELLYIDRHEPLAQTTANHNRHQSKGGGGSVLSVFSKSRGSAVESKQPITGKSSLGTTAVPGTLKPK